MAGSTVANGGVPLSSATPQPVGTANPGAVTSSSRADHVHSSSLAVQQDVTVSAPAAGHALVYTGTAWSNVAQAVPSLASITGPLYTGRLEVNNADNGLYRYTGSAWLFVASLSDTGGTVQYKAAALQTVATGSVDKLKFGTPVMTSTPDVTVSGVGNTDFTLQRTGRWLMQANVPWGAGPNGNFSCWAWVGSATDSTATGRHAVASGAPNNFVVFLAPNKVKRFNAGTVLSVYGYQDTGVSRDVVINQGDLDVTLTFLGP